MMAWMRGSMSVAGVTAVALILAACQTTNSSTANLNTIGAPQQQQFQPVQSSTVQQGNLPAIGATGTPAPGLSGQPVLGGVSTQPTSTTIVPGTTTPMTAPMTTPTGPSTSMAALNSPMGASSVGGGPEGTWNVTAGATTCRLNLPRTEKTGTNYFRASAPGCTVSQISSITGWQQVGSQLQLYDENGNIAAFLAPSSGRYIGTMGGGQAISMSR